MGNSVNEGAGDGEGEIVRGADLTERQYDCLLRAGEGMSSKEIGRVLGISPSTVDNHIHVAITKLNAKIAGMLPNCSIRTGPKML